MHKELVNAKENIQQHIQMKEELENEVSALNAQVSYGHCNTCRL